MLCSTLIAIKQVRGAAHRGGSVDQVCRHRKSLAAKPGWLSLITTLTGASDHNPQPRLVVLQRQGSDTPRRLVVARSAKRQTQWDGEGEGVQGKDLARWPYTAVENNS